MQTCNLCSDYSYIGIELRDASWEVVSRCCIFPPDAAFGGEPEGWENAFGESVRKERLILFWRMDEPEIEYTSAPAQRPRLHTLLASFSQLCNRYAERTDGVIIHALRRKPHSPRRGSDWPSINYQLLHSGFNFADFEFQLEEHLDDEFEASLPPALPPLSKEFCQLAKSAWMKLVAERVKFLLETIKDARSYEMLKPMLDEWLRYARQLDSRCLDWNVDVERFQFLPWYAEVLSRMPRLNPRGLCVIPLLSIRRFALLDYRPEEGRRFCYEALDLYRRIPSGKLRRVDAGDNALPYDAVKHLHLLPVCCDKKSRNLVIAGVKMCVFYEEDWLGKDYQWDKPIE